MLRRQPILIWRKTATARWLAKNEAHLHQCTDGTYAVIERPGRQRLIEAVCYAAHVARELREMFGGAIIELPSDWEERALASTKTKPLRIGRRLIVASDENDVTSDSATAMLTVPAGAAFGTGEHATTAMSLRMLERITRRLEPGWRMLDAGTGSGILALAGHRFGAGKVVALDNDPLAVSTAKENGRRNNVRGIQFQVDDATTKQRGSFDIIAANLYSELLVAALPVWRANLCRGARLVLSGVMRAQEGDLVRALRKNGYATDETRRRGKWIALLCRQKRS